MKWLTMDTSTSTLGISIMDEETVWGEMTTNLKRHHSERLLPAINHLLSETKIELNDLGGIAVTRGPGSYTGVRIGVTTAKIFAWSLDLPLIGVSSLAALAVNGQRFAGSVIPMWDARRERVYTAHYRFRAQEELVEEKDDRVVPVKTWIDNIAHEHGPFLLLGDGAVRYRSLIISRLGDRAVFASTTENIVRPSSVGRLAVHQWRREGSDDISRFAPEYLQVTEAEANWDKQNRMNGQQL